MTFDYSLTSLLPFARAAIRQSANFDIEQFTDALFAELEKVGVRGVERARMGRLKFKYSELIVPAALKYGSMEVFFHLVHRGFILPEPQNFPTTFNEMRYWRTAKGTAWSADADPPPEEVEGYMRLLLGLTPALDPIITEYVREGLSSFHREMFFSASVMLGAASEKEIYLLGQAMAGALKDANAQSKLNRLLEGRSLYQLLKAIEEHVRSCAKLRGVFDGAHIHLMSLFESIRKQRNDAVHPNTATVDEDSVRLAYNSFPKAVEKAEALRAWFGSNSRSV
jgi:hypothetical protein